MMCFNIAGLEVLTEVAVKTTITWNPSWLLYDVACSWILKMEVIFFSETLEFLRTNEIMLLILISCTILRLGPSPNSINRLVSVVETYNQIKLNLCGGTLGTAASTSLFFQPRMIGEGDCGEKLVE
jgi:hypothetical protein